MPQKAIFFATMSHEFRTPINVLLSSIQLFENYVRNEDNSANIKIEKHLKSMKRNSLRLLRLVNNLIDLSKIDTGFFLPNFKNHNIVSIIEKIVFSVKDYASQNNIELGFKSRQKYIKLKCDADIIERIMLNLISNAIKFSNKISNSNCSIKISIDKKNDYIVIRVKDNGIGIEKDKKDIIFERYKQVQTILSRKSEGSGIGLSITKALVEMHDGQITVKSKPGIGSEFIVKIPHVTIENDDIQTDPNKNDEQNLILMMNVEFSDIYI